MIERITASLPPSLWLDSPRTNDWSILSAFTGYWCKYDNEE